MKEFWEGVHQRGEVLFLADSGATVMEKLMLPALELDGPIRSLLNIGVGFGRFEQWARLRVDRLDALDIAEAAGTAVAGVVDNFYTTPEQLPEDTYDLITSVLVAQHVDNDTLRGHLRHGISALKPDGVFAIQVPAHLNPPTEEDMRVRFTEAWLQGGGAFRSVEEMERLIGECGGDVVFSGWHSEYPQWNSVWHAYHIRRAAG